MMYQVIIVIHVLLGLGVVGLVLMQQGKGADAGAAFGTGSSGSVFGAQGAASFLSRSTAILATLFFMTSLGLAVLNGKQGAAYDLMSAPKVEQDTLGIPDVGGAKGLGDTSAVPDLKSEEVPVAAPVDSKAEKAAEKK
ncbi:MAG TPA: preprotein translocase subunit SecG [Methylobacter sp.]